MFLDLPDDINEEKSSFLQLKKNALRTDGRTDASKNTHVYKFSFLVQHLNLNVLDYLDLDIVCHKISEILKIYIVSKNV